MLSLVEGEPSEGHVRGWARACGQRGLQVWGAGPPLARAPALPVGVSGSAGNRSLACLLLLFRTLGGFLSRTFGEFSRIGVDLSGCSVGGRRARQAGHYTCHVSCGVASGRSPRPSDTSVPTWQNGPLCGFGLGRLVLRMTRTSGAARAAWRRPSHPSRLPRSPLSWRRWVLLC